MGSQGQVLKVGANGTITWGADDDVPEAGDFGAATYLDANGALNTNSVSDNEMDYTNVTLNDFTFDVGSVSKTEFGYLNGVISAIQTQLDGKQPTSKLDTIPKQACFVSPVVGDQAEMFLPCNVTIIAVFVTGWEETVHGQR